MKSLTNALTNVVKRPVIDETGLQGNFDWKLEWTPDQPVASSPGLPGDKTNAPALLEVSGPSIFGALQEQLGLRLESRKAPELVIAVESAFQALPKLKMTLTKVTGSESNTQIQ